MKGLARLITTLKVVELLERGGQCTLITGGLIAAFRQSHSKATIYRDLNKLVSLGLVTREEFLYKAVLGHNYRLTVEGIEMIKSQKEMF